MKIMALCFLIASNVLAQQASFEHGKQVAESLKGGAGGGVDMSNVSQYQDGYFIHSDKLKQSFETLEGDAHGSVLRDIHKTRKPFILDDTEDFMVRSEEAHQNPEKAFEEVEAVEAGSESYTTETCEECPDEEYFVKARMIKKRYVYLQTPPYITAGQGCENHGWLTIKVEIVSEPEEIFREDGVFNDIMHISTVPWGGAYVDETYRVNGVNIVLRKTIQQNGHPWIHPRCYLVPALQAHVVSVATMIQKLLGGSEDESIYWGQIGYATLHHRVVNDTGEHYWLPDDAYKHYEELCDQGLCRYESFEDDPPSDKFWKGKKVNGSWGRTMTFACRSSCKDTCAELRARGCSREPNPECLEEKGGTGATLASCLRWKWTFKCKDKVAVAKHKFSKKNPFCLGGDCIDSSYESDRDMVQALGYLSILEEARKEMDGTANIQVFKGESHGCNKIRLGAGIKDCCGTYKGLGVSLGLTKCDEDAKTLAKLRGEGKCVYVGTHCAEEINVGLAKFCIRHKSVFCCFGTKFAKLLQEQGKPQLGMGFGSSKEPSCVGFTPEQLASIDFSKLDLTEITNDVMERFKPESGEHFAKAGELDKIREQMESKHVQAAYDSPSAKTQKTVSDIATMPMDQRRTAIADVIQQANSKNLLPEEKQKLQAYLDATAPITPPTYAPTFVLKHTAWGHHDGYTHVRARGLAGILGRTTAVLTAAYSFDDEYSVDPVTKAETYIGRHKYYDTPSYNAVHMRVDKSNQSTTTKNEELETEYRQKLDAQQSAPVPLEAISKIMTACEIADMPLEQRMLHRAPSLDKHGSTEAQHLQQNMRHLTGSLKPKGGK